MLPFGTELFRSQRLYEKSYDIGTSPGTNTGLAGSIEEFNVSNASVARVRFAVPKRSSPTITTYDSVGNSGKVSTEGSNNNVTPNSVDNTGNSGFKVYHPAINRLSFHWVADNDL